MIAQAIQAARIGGFDLIIIMETKITNQAYCCNKMEYDVVCSKVIMSADDNAKGGLEMIVWEKPQFWSI